MLPALPLLKAAGFEQTQANGEDLLQLNRLDVDLLERAPSLKTPGNEAETATKRLETGRKALNTAQN